MRPGHHILHVRLAVLLGCLLCLPLGCGEPGVEPKADVTTVYGALLAHHLPEAARLKGEAHQFVIQRMSKVDETTFGEDLRPPGVESTDRVADEWASLKSGLERLRRDTWEAFLAANAAPHDLSKSVQFSGPMVLLTEEEVDDLFSDGCDEGYARIFKRFPDARTLMALSMPGVAEDGTQALVYRERMSGGLAGSGVYYLLERKDGVWRIVFDRGS